MSGGEHAETILVVDDAPETLEVLSRNLGAEGYRVFTAPGAAEAVKLLGKTPIDLVVTDLKMPKVSGLDLVRHVRENFRDTEVMMITGYATVEGAVDAVKTGAEEYLPKPFTDSELSAAVRRALAKLHLRRTSQTDSPLLSGARHGITGESEAVQKVMSAVAKAGRHRADHR